MKIIRTASGPVNLSTYARAWAATKAAAPGTIYRSGLCHWGPTSREEILRNFSDGLHDRINQHISGYGRGRRWSDDYEIEARRVARYLAARVQVYASQVPADLRVRIAHRLVERE